MTVRDFIIEGRYANLVPFSVPEQKPHDDMTVRQARDLKATNASRKATQHRLHREEEARLNALFKADLEAEYGTTAHPRAGRLFELAWGMGHANGYGEVYDYYGELVTLIT